MKLRSFLERFIYSFPVQLVIMHVKKNQLVLIYWVLLFAFVTQSISERFGIPYLFLDPEYLGKVDFRSFFIVGITCGAFIMAYNISSYILNSFRFPFLASLSKPFLKYSLNNFILPLLFILVYVVSIVRFQYLNQFDSPVSITINVVSFLSGVYIIVIITLRYFLLTNKDIYKLFGVEQADMLPALTEQEKLERDERRKRERENQKQNQKKQWRVETYLSNPLTLRLVRSTAHYKNYMLQSVFKQNHINAAVIELIVFAIFILLGLLREFEIVQIPAAASLLLLFTMLIMLSGVFRFWLKAWSNAALIGLFIFLNFMSQFDFINQKNKAIGLDYTKEPRHYSVDAITSSCSPKQREKDILSTISILENWKSKWLKMGVSKPKLVVVNVSGGGLRSSYFTFNVLQKIDSTLNGRLMDHTSIITGSSGGMIGASYYRGLYLQQGKNFNYNNPVYLDNIGQDLLNATMFSFTVSDLFFNLQSFTENENRYFKDRGYAFEQQLNKNLEDVLDVRLGDYKQAEAEARIPMLVMAPTIINDGRFLLVSTTGMSYLLQSETSSNGLRPIPDGIDFGHFFADNNPLNTSFTSLLRMNATFPYIMPSTVLPTTPILEVTDAGMRDNYGIINSVRFIHKLHDWIKENTSGVILIQIRDTNKRYKQKEPESNTILSKITSPLRNVTGNFILMQDYIQDDYLRYISEWIDVPFNYILFELPSSEQQVALSWHLTEKEKSFLRTSSGTESNLINLKKISELLETGAVEEEEGIASAAR